MPVHPDRSRARISREMAGRHPVEVGIAVEQHCYALRGSDREGWSVCAPSGEMLTVCSNRRYAETLVAILNRLKDIDSATRH